MFVRHTKRCLIITVMFGTVFFWLYASGRADSAKNYLELPYVVVHIDLKGMPPKLSYLKSILPKLKELGANALLMEYEDMFPYEGSIRNISSKHAYSKLHLSEFLREAQILGFEIIPLVQTFGHLEFVLKHWEFAHLRENAFSPDSICPTNDDSHTLIETMLQQVFQFHNDISPLKHFHIGCDEVYNINLCPRCKERKLQNLVLFVDHVNNVHRILKSFDKSISILIWDDMIRKLKRSSFVILNRLQDIEPVYWKYNPGVTDAHRPLIFYKRRFKHTWIATAFKGADGRTRMLPDLHARLHNNFDWLKNMFDYRHIYSFKGIILTGWSKYGHLDPPCEVLPASMPSLTLNLLLVRKYKQGLDLNSSTLTAGLFYRKHIEPHLERELKCNLEYRISLKYSNIHDCKLASGKLIKVLYNFGKFHKLIVQTYFNDRAGLDTVDYYYKKYNVVSNNLHYHKNWANESLRTLEYYATYLSVYLYEYYDGRLINEYVNFRTEYLKQLITQLHFNLKSLDTIRVYDRESNQFHIFP